MRQFFPFTMGILFCLFVSSIQADELTLDDMYAKDSHSFTSLSKDNACQWSKSHWYNQKGSLINISAADPICSCKQTHRIDLRVCEGKEDCLIEVASGWACNFLGPVNTAAASGIQ